MSGQLLEWYRIKELADIAMSSQPAWLFDASGRNIWSNASGENLARQHPSILGTVSQTIPRVSGRAHLEKIRLFPSFQSPLTTCAFSAGEAGVLCVALDMKSQDNLSDPRKAELLLENSQQGLRIEDTDGTLLASNDTGHNTQTPDESFALGKTWRLLKYPETDTAKPDVPIRFTWRMDLEGRITAISPELGEITGKTADIVGQKWHDINHTLALDPGERIEKALAKAARSWSNVKLSWPVENSQERLELELSGLPRLNKDRELVGYRGFGIIRDETQLRVIRAEQRLRTATQQARDAMAAAEAPQPAAEPSQNEPLTAVEASNFIEIAKVIESSVDPSDTIVPPPQSAAQKTPPHGLKLIPLTFETLQDLPLPEEPEEEDFERTRIRENGPKVLSLPLTAQASMAIHPINVWGQQITPPYQVGMLRHLEETLVRQPLPARLSPEGSEMGNPPADKPALMPQTPKPETAGHFLEELPFGAMILVEEKPVAASQKLLMMAGAKTLSELESAELFTTITSHQAFSDQEKSAFDLEIPSEKTRHFHIEKKSLQWNDEPATGVFIIPQEIRIREIRKKAAEPVAPTVPAADSQSALHQAEAATRELAAILDTATDGVLVIDRQGHILTINRSAEALFGLERNAAVGQLFTNLFAPESTAAAQDYLEGLAANGVASVLNDGRDVIGMVQGGGLIPLFMTMGRVGENGDKFCAVLRDITIFKKAEEELVTARRQAEHASAQKSDFLARISHEIRTPLNAIIGFSEVMMEQRFGPVENERYREYLKDIHTSGGLVLSLVNDLLDLSKIEAGKLDLSFTSVDLNDLVRQCTAIMQPQANRERIIIRSSLGRPLPEVVADSRSMRQIILNLLSNSIKFTPSGGQVIISTALTPENEAVLRVRDTGVGMSEKDIATAMEPFRQIATTGEVSAGGTGLGLPLTKALAEANRAGFEIKSTPGKGTLVEIRFPATRVLVS